MANDLIQRGLQQHRAGFIKEAETIYEQALAINPRDPDALHLLGLTALQSGAAGKAAELIRKATILEPKNWAFHANLAAALVEQGDLDGALAAYRQATRFNPDEPQFQMGIANCHALRGEFAEAEVQLRGITRRFPGFALAWFNLGNAVRDQGRTEEAADLYRRALEADSTLANAQNNLANALHALGQLDAAEQAYRRALALMPDDAMAHCNLASVLIDRGRFAAAETAGRQAIACDPQSALAHSFLAAAIGHQGRLHEALEWHRKAAALAPDHARTLMALGTALYEIGMPAEGLPLLERVVALAPDAWEPHFSLANVKLALGEFAEGWREFIYRPARVRFVKLCPDVTLTSTLPQTLTGRDVCVLSEQGLGDQLFFLRFVGCLKARGARVTYRSTPKIASILGRVASIDRVIPDTEPVPQADYTLLVSDLPLALAPPIYETGRQSGFAERSPRPPGEGLGVRDRADYVELDDSLPGPREKTAPLVPPPLALTPLAEHLAVIASRLAQFGPPPSLGLTWRGGVAPEEQGGMSWMLFKQIPLQQLGSTLSGIGATFLALQRHPQPGEIGQLSASIGKPVHDLTALNEDLEAMLALLALIDAYIGVSNTNMHLRAGVGRTARVLVPCPAEWRWMARGEESPWFPGFTIYRQKTDGDWSAALEKLRNDVRVST